MTGCSRTGWGRSAAGKPCRGIGSAGCSEQGCTVYTGAGRVLGACGCHWLRRGFVLLGQYNEVDMSCALATRPLSVAPPNMSSSYDGASVGRNLDVSPALRTSTFFTGGGSNGSAADSRRRRRRRAAPPGMMAASAWPSLAHGVLPAMPSTAVHELSAARARASVSGQRARAPRSPPPSAQPGRTRTECERPHVLERDVAGRAAVNHHLRPVRGDHQDGRVQPAAGGREALGRGHHRPLLAGCGRVREVGGCVCECGCGRTGGRAARRTDVERPQIVQRRERLGAAAEHDHGRLAVLLRRHRGVHPARGRLGVGHLHRRPRGLVRRRRERPHVIVRLVRVGHAAEDDDVRRAGGHDGRVALPRLRRVARERQLLPGVRCAGCV